MKLKKRLEEIYHKYNKRDFVDPDPLMFLYEFSENRDVEIVGLIASSLAYGRVKQILKSVKIVLSAMEDSPYNFIMNNPDVLITETFHSFKHRFTTGDDLSRMLLKIKNIINEHTSLENCFISGYDESDKNVIPALTHFAKKFDNPLLPDPDKGSACKRLHLFLRWMVRKDDVDPGIWKDIPSSKLIIPLDTHMHSIAKILGFTQRKPANIRTAIEITEKFLEIEMCDPVKYDFSLTRFGIREDMNTDQI